jgi:hypothetical protein
MRIVRVRKLPFNQTTAAFDAAFGLLRGCLHFCFLLSSGRKYGTSA